MDGNHSLAGSRMGSRRSPSPQFARITDYLTQDHERLHELLEQARRPGSFQADPFASFRGGLLRHIAIEERVLLPAAREARGGLPLSRAHELRVEHAALTSLLVPVPDLSLCSEIAELLGRHDRKEEGPEGVYAECEAAFSPAESARLAEVAASYRQVRMAPHSSRPNLYRTAASALAAASRLEPPRSGTR